MRCLVATTISCGTELSFNYLLLETAASATYVRVNQESEIDLNEFRTSSRCEISEDGTQDKRLLMIYGIFWPSALSQVSNAITMNGNFIPQAYRVQVNNHANDQRTVERNSVESRYETLKEAILHKDRGSVVWLINEGCPVNDAKIDKISDTPLHAAVFVNDVEVLKMLISEGAEVNAANFQKQTPLHLAFEMGNSEMVDLLLSQCDGRVNPFTVYGLSHFHIACVRNNWRVANSFLERGVNANIYLEKYFYGKDYVYYRPLHLAVKYENLEVAELLLKYGANVNARDRFKRTPLHLACRYNCKKICEEIAMAERLVDVLYLVKAGNDQVDIVEMLLRYRADVDVLDSNDTPPLFHVFKCDYREIRDAIRDRFHVDDEEFWQDIVQVFKATQRQKFYVLIQRDADIRFCNESKDTFVHLVIDGKKLFTHCNTLNAKERDLTDEEKAEMVDLLLKYGADVDAKNANGQTPLHLAISSYYYKTAKTILNHYASVSNVCFFHYKIPKRDTGGNFDLTQMENFLDIVSLILKKKSDLGVSRTNELLLLRSMVMESNIQHFENCCISDLPHLLDFGDINSMNLSFYASERSLLSNREKITLILEHIHKLELAGLYVREDIKIEF